MSTDDVDAEQIISRLAGPLSPPDRKAFRRAAEDALTRVPCWGEGALYRAVAALQRAYFNPPNDRRMSWDISQELPRGSKLTKAAPIGRDDPRCGRRRARPKTSSERRERAARQREAQ